MAEQPTMPCQNHFTHSYNFDEVALGTGSNQQPYFRAMIFFRKKPEHTEEFFHEHWKSVHADLTMSAETTGVALTRYVQFHQDARHREMIAPLIESGYMKAMPWDGCAEFHCKDSEDFTKFLDDITSSKELIGCGSRFVDMQEGMHIMVGYDNLIMGNTTDLSGTNGIKRTDARLKTPFEKKEAVTAKA